MRREQRGHHDRGAGAILDQRLPFFDQRHELSVDRAGDAAEIVASDAARRIARRTRIGVGAQPLFRRETVGLAAKQRKTAAGLPHRRGVSVRADGQVEAGKGRGADQTDYEQRNGRRPQQQVRQRTAESNASARKNIAQGAKLFTGKSAPGALAISFAR